MKDTNNEEKEKENIRNSIKNNNNNSFKEKNIEENGKKCDENSNNSKNIKSFEEDEENENEDFKIEEYEEKHLNSIMNMKNTHSITNSNSAMNINNIIIEENIDTNKNVMTLGKEIQSNSEIGSLMNSKTSIPTKEKRFIKKLLGEHKLDHFDTSNITDMNNIGFNKDNGEITWKCPRCGYCTFNLWDLLADNGKMIDNFDISGCGCCK